MNYVSYIWLWPRAQWLYLRSRARNFRRDFPLYVRRIRLNPEFGRLDSAPCVESEWPYREGTAMVLRVVASHGLTVGIMNNHSDRSHNAVNKRLIQALQSADGTESYWDTPERRAAAEADSELPVKLMRSAEDIETTERTSGGLPVQHEEI